jgi:hypothetical protein
MKKALFAALVACMVLVVSAPIASAAGSGGVTGASFYVDGTLYRTVNTPTDLSNTGGPPKSFDTIYQFFGVQTYNVATAQGRVRPRERVPPEPEREADLATLKRRRGGTGRPHPCARRSRSRTQVLIRSR